MPDHSQEHIVYRLLDTGTDIAQVRGEVNARPDLVVLKQGHDALLVEGNPALVQAVLDRLSGWAVEVNGRVRGGV